MHVFRVVARIDALDFEHSALHRAPEHAVRQSLADHHRKQSHDRNAHANNPRRRAGILPAGF